MRSIIEQTKHDLSSLQGDITERAKRACVIVQNLPEKLQELSGSSWFYGNRLYLCIDITPEIPDCKEICEECGVCFQEPEVDFLTGRILCEGLLGEDIKVTILNVLPSSNCVVEEYKETVVRYRKSDVHNEQGGLYDKRRNKR